MRKLKIKSDGLASGTSVVDAETGVEIDGVTAITWTCDVASRIARATITVIGCEVEIDAIEAASDA